METYEGLEHFTLISPLFFYFFLRIYKKRENGYRRHYLERWNTGIDFRRQILKSIPAL